MSLRQLRSWKRVGLALVLGALLFTASAPAAAQQPVDPLRKMHPVLQALWLEGRFLEEAREIDGRTHRFFFQSYEARWRGFSEAFEIGLEPDLEPVITVLALTDGPAADVDRAIEEIPPGYFIGPSEKGGLPRTIVRVVSRLNDIAVVRLPMVRLGALAALPSVVRVEPVTRLRPAIGNASMSAAEGGTGVTTVREQHKLDGANVLVAIIDNGVEPSLPDFQSPDGSTRIERVFDAATWSTSGAPTDRSPFVTTAAEIDAGATLPGPADHGHGVAATAAGSGVPLELVAPGVAPASDLLIVRGSEDTMQLVEGLRWIDEVATELDRPVAINLSLGGQIGPHDGSNLANRFDVSIPSRLVALAAGNYGDALTHARGQLAAGSGILFDLDVPFDSNVPPKVVATTFAIWYDGRLFDSAGNLVPEGETSFGFNLISPSGEIFSFPSVSPGSMLATQTTTAGPTTGISVLHALDENFTLPPPDQKRNKMIMVSLQGQPVAPGKWRISLTRPASGGGVGRFDAWINVQNGSRWVRTPGQPEILDPLGTVVDEATTAAPNALVVGSYLTPNGLSGFPGDLSAFSSLGPTRDNRLKPDIAAPGDPIFTTHGFLDPVVDPQTGETVTRLVFRAGTKNGTSFAAPQVAGAAALLLQIDPSLSGAEIATILKTTARADEFTGSLPNLLFGHGKLNVEAAVASLAARDSDADGFTNLDEAFITTDPLSACGVGAYGTGAWPPDTNDSLTVNVFDAFALLPLGRVDGDPDYERRDDLDTNGAITEADADRLEPPGRSCGATLTAAQPSGATLSLVPVHPGRAGDPAAPIQLDLVAASDHPIAAVQIGIRYNPARLELVDVSPAWAGPFAARDATIVQLETDLDAGLRFRTSDDAPLPQSDIALDTDGEFGLLFATNGDAVTPHSPLVRLTFRRRSPGDTIVSLQPLPGLGPLIDADLNDRMPALFIPATITAGP